MSAAARSHPLAAGCARRVLVVGQGVVGLSVALRAVEVGHDVVGFDVDGARVELLAAGRSPVSDPPGDAVAAAVATGRYLPTDRPECCADFDVAIIAVPTPLRSGAPDLRQLRLAAGALGRFVRPGALVIVESTCRPGATEELVAPLLASSSGLTPGEDFHLAYSPERIDPGNQVHRLARIPKLVAGLDAGSAACAVEFYRGLVDTVVPMATIREAEFAKLLENVFRFVNIALANELCAAATALGVDYRRALEGAATKPFGFMAFHPGPGIGGDCIPVAPHHLDEAVRSRLGTPLRFVQLATEVDREMPARVVRGVEASLARRGLDLAGSRVLVLGVAYKRNVGDARSSSAVEVVRLLAAAGACVRVADPNVAPGFDLGGVPRVAASEEEVRSADEVVLLTDHDAFDYDMIRRHARHVFDTRYRVDGPDVERL
jgi:UDP-N-acetyl-D-glucosamine dehydrogenase